MEFLKELYKEYPKLIGLDNPLLAISMLACLGIFNTAIWVFNPVVEVVAVLPTSVFLAYPLIEVVVKKTMEDVFGSIASFLNNL